MGRVATGSGYLTVPGVSHETAMCGSATELRPPGMAAGVCIRLPRRQLARDLSSIRRGFITDSIDIICFLLVALIVHSECIATTFFFLRIATDDRATSRLAKTSRAVLYPNSRPFYTTERVMQVFQTSSGKFASPICLIQLRTPLWHTIPHKCTCRSCVRFELCLKGLHSPSSRRQVYEGVVMSL